MSSPFGIFRKHQKIMLVVLIGLSMLSFVIFGTVSQASDLQNMPPGLTAIALAALVAAVAWVIGIPNGKSGEYGTIGLIAGLALGAVVWLRSGSGDVVTTRDFGLNQNELNQLMNQRALANRFVAYAIDRSTAPENQFLASYLAQQYQFQLDRRVDDFGRDVLLGELLRRKARDLDMSLPESAVNDFIKEMTQDKMTQQMFREIRSELAASESDLYTALRNELLAQMAARSLYGYIGLPPAVDWELSQRLQVQQKLEVAEVPIAPFIDDKAEPPADELQTLFEKHRQFPPGYDEQGQPKEGSPGFLQPRRIKIGYLTPDYLAFEKQVKITDEQIEARYLRDYASIGNPLEGLIPDGPDPLGGPLFPNSTGDAGTPAGDETAPATPADDTETPDPAAGDADPSAGTDGSDAPAPTPTPAPEGAPTTEAPPATTEPATPAEPQEQPSEPTTEEPQPEPAADPSCDDTPAATEAATEAAAEATPAAESADAADAPATADAPASTDAPASEPVGETTADDKPEITPGDSTDPFPNIPGVVGPPGTGEQPRRCRPAKCRPSKRSRRRSTTNCSPKRPPDSLMSRSPPRSRSFRMKSHATSTSRKRRS
ncbi:MAG: hypothetical protein R3B90_01690 [Planctomycetaceae bacterium]